MKVRSTDFWVEEGQKVNLDKWPTAVEPIYESKKQYQKMLANHVDELSSLQESLKKALALFLFREVKIKLDYAGAVAVRCLSRSTIERNRLCQGGLVVNLSVCNSLAAEDLGMHADDQYLFVIGSVKDADPPRSGRSRVVRHRKSCCNSAALGCL